MGEGTFMKIMFTFFILLASVIAFGQEAAEYAPDWVPVDPVFVPPSWLESVLLSIKEFPLIGSVLVHVSQWAGVLAVITTSFAGALIVSLRALKTVLPLVNLVAWIPLIEKYANPAIYWLKYFSLFNASKK